MNLVLIALAALAGGALALVVLWPLRQRSRAGFLAGGASMAIAGACLYLLVGRPEAGEHPTDPAADLQQGVMALQRSLQNDPAQPEGWMLLGRALAELGQPTQAAAAFARAVALSPDEPLLLVEAAQARAQADSGKQFDDTALRWLEQAHQRDPNAERASWLLGIALRQRGRNDDAVQVWSALLPRLQAGAAEALSAQIEIARSAGDSPASAAASAPAPLLQVQASLPATVDAAQWPAEAALFVIVRDIDGSPMPVAARRLPLAQLPSMVQLSDADSVMPTRPLSAQAQVDLQLRLSRSGSATPGPGDVESAMQRIELRAGRPAPEVKVTW